MLGRALALWLVLAATADAAISQGVPLVHAPRVRDDAPHLFTVPGVVLQGRPVHLSRPRSPPSAASFHSADDATQPADVAAARQRGGAPGGAGRVPPLVVGLMTLAMALAAGLGALPYFFVGNLDRTWSGLANAVASGVMLAASFGLVAEGGPHGAALLVAGMLAGAAFIKLSQHYLEDYEVEGFEELKGAEARKVILFLAVMAAHALGEGSGVGVSFAGARGWAQGTSVTLAIGLHNIPEGLAVATVMAAKGSPPARAMLWCVLTALPQALVAVPSYLFVEAFSALLPLAMGFAGGCMMWIVVAELLPDALEAVPADQVATTATVSAAWLVALSLYVNGLEQPNGTLASPIAASAVPALEQLVVGLLPACALPAIAAGAVCALRLSLPVVSGLVGGMLAALGAVGAVQALAAAGGGGAGAGGSASAVAVAAVAAGALVAAAAWRKLGAAAAAAAPAAASDKKDDSDPEAAVDVIVGPPQVNGRPKPLQNGVAHGAASHDAATFVSLNGHHNHAADGGGGAAAANGHAYGHAVLNGYGQAKGLTATTAAALLQRKGSGPGLPSTLRKMSSSSSGDEGAGGGNGAQGTGGRRNGSDAALAAGGPRSAGAWHALAAGGGALAAYSAAHGFGVAVAASQQPDEASHLLVPSVLLGVQLGVASVGLLLPFLGRNPRRVASYAALIAAVGPIVAPASLLLGSPDGTAELDPWRLQPHLQAAAAGAALCMGARLLGRHCGARAGAGRRRAVLGAAAGLACVLLLTGLQAVLCLATPYCV